MTNKKDQPELANGWKYINEEPPPHGTQVLVTNNPGAMSPKGMSHIWISGVYKADKKTDGDWVGFTDSDRKIMNLIAWHPLPGLPMPKQQQ